MNAYLPFLVFGVVVGSIYGLAAMGLVLTYRTSGIFNFGHGAVGAGAAYVFYELRQRQGVPWPVAAVIAVVLFGVAAGVLLELTARGLVRVPVSYQIVGTVGLLLLVRAAATWIYGPEYRLFDPFLSHSTAFTIAGVAVTWESVIIFVTVGLVAVALYLVVERTRPGMTMRAVVDDPSLLDMTGISPARVRRQAWLLGSCFAAASGVLLAAQQQQLDATLLSLLVIQAFGAAALGAFRSLPMAYAGGIAVGVAQKLVSKEAANHSWLQGLDFNLPFLVLFFVLLVLGRRRLGDLGAGVRVKAVLPNRAPVAVQRLVTAGGLVFALVVPQLVGARLPVWINAMSQVLLFLSLGLLVNISGQVSLCQMALAAVGAAAFAHTVAGGVPWGLGVLLGGLIAVPVGAVVAIPAIRLSGLFLALATLGFGVFIAQFCYVKSYLFGFSDLHTARPHALGLDTDKGYYYLLLTVAVAGIAAVLSIERSRLGRLLRGLGDSPIALQTLGASADVTRVLVFCLSAFLAGVSGALFAGQFGSVSGTSFNYVNSLVLLAVLSIAGRTTVQAAAIGPIAMVVAPAYLTSLSDALQVLFGLGAILTAILAVRPGQSSPRPMSARSMAVGLRRCLDWTT